MRKPLAAVLLVGLALAVGQVSNLPGAKAGWKPAPRPAGDVLDLTVSGGQGPVWLRLHFEIDGRPAHVAWDAFLDQLFAFYDVNGDGHLDVGELARVPPLPLPGPATSRKVVHVLALGLRKKGWVSREDLKEYYRRSGFTPVATWEQLPSPETRQLSEVLFKHLDQNRDGRLSRAELDDAPALLRKFDQDEDEVLTPAELLVLEAGPAVSQPKASIPPRKAVSVGMNTKDGPPRRPDLEVRVAWTGDKAAAVPLGGAGAGPNGFLRRTLSDVALTLGPASGEGQRGLQAAANFVRSQFKIALAEGKYLEKKQIEQNPGLQFLLRVFEQADRNGDGKLTLAELEGFLKLVEQGARCQAVVVMRDEGRNLFDLLDTNRDGLLDLRELRQAGRLVTAYDPHGRDTVGPSDLPRQVQVLFQRGLANGLLGPVTAAGKPKPDRPATPPAPRGPLWFRKMDRNQDGYLSPREFLGTPELFRRLDKDGDGLISVEEAEQAEGQRPNP